MNIVIFIVAYLIFAGIAYPMVLDRVVSRCVFTSHYAGKNADGKRVDAACRDHHKPTSAMLSIAAPVIIPFLLGSIFTDSEGRLERSRSAEIANIKHAKKMASAQLELLSIQEKQAGLHS